MRRIEVWIIAGLTSLSLFGCATATRFNVQIDALAREPIPVGVTPSAHTGAPHSPIAAPYLLLPADVSVDPRSLEYETYARTLEEALAAQGFERVTDSADAEIVILFDYGVGDEDTAIVTYPRSPFAYAPYDPFGYGGRGRRLRGAGRRNRGFIGGFYPGSIYGPAGLASARTYTTYNRFVVIEARRLDSTSPDSISGESNDTMDPRNGTPVWSTRIESRGASDDLRRVLPVLLGAGSEYFGTDSGERIETSVREDDPRVTQLRPVAIASPDADPEAAQTEPAKPVPSWVPSN